MANEWVLYLNSDAQVSQQTNGILSRYDLQQLRNPSGWMTDSLIHYGVTEYNGSRGDFHNNVYWILPTFVKMAKDGRDDAFDDSLGQSLGVARHLDNARQNLPGNGNAVLFPVNTSDTHWSLLAFYKQNRSFVHYDSLGQSNDESAKALITKLRRKGYLSRRLNFTKPVEIVRQQDGYNCGLYVIQFARKIMEVGRKLTGDEIGAITSDTSDTLREAILTALQPHFPAAPVMRPVPAYAIATTTTAKKTPAPKKKHKKDIILKKSFLNANWKRKRKIKTAVLLATNNDKLFTNCFLATGYKVREIIKGNLAHSLMELTDEARGLWGVLGRSSEVLTKPPRKKKNRVLSKYETYKSKKEPFTLQPQVLPDTVSKLLLEDRIRNTYPLVTPEGFQPSFFQFQRQEMNIILNHCEKSVKDLNHNHQHITRSLILGKAMADFYVEHGQPRFLPGDTRPDEMRKKSPKNDEQRRAGLSMMPVPADNEIDMMAIAVGVGLHDSARLRGGEDVWEHESARNVFYYLRELGYSCEYAEYVGGMIVKDEGNTDKKKTSTESAPPQKGAVSRKKVPVSHHAATTHKKSPVNTITTENIKSTKHQQSLNEQIVHDADTLEIQRVPKGRNFKKKLLGFLTDQNLDKVNVDSPETYRDQLIADAKLFIELTTEVSKKAKAGEDENPSAKGRMHFEDILDDYRQHTDKFGGYFEAHESQLIEAIVEKPKAFPFLYKYYFHECFNPKDTYFQQLSPDERLALVRARIHTRERLPRDYYLAQESFKKKKPEQLAATFQQFIEDLPQLQLTINLRPNQLSEVIDTVKQKQPDHLQQFWEVFFKTGKGRAGASTDHVARDDAERRKVQYQIPCESKHFLRPNRPKYTALNLAHTTTGACPKYGKCAYILKPHVWNRVTLAHNDTFNDNVFPDDLCTPAFPYTLLREIKEDRFNPYILRLYASGKGEMWAAKTQTSAQKGSEIPYIESHVHGLVKWETDVEEIRIEVTATDPNKSAEELAKLNGVPVEVCPDWAGFDQKVIQFAGQWTSKERPNGIPVRFVHADRVKLYSTRADAMSDNNEIKDTVVSGKLVSPKKLEASKSTLTQSAPKTDLSRTGTQKKSSGTATNSARQERSPKKKKQQPSGGYKCPKCGKLYPNNFVPKCSKVIEKRTKTRKAVFCDTPGSKFVPV